MGEKGECIKKYKLILTEQSWGYKMQHMGYSQYSNNYVQCQMSMKFRNDHLVIYIMFSHWVVRLKLIQYCMSTIIEIFLKINKRNN